jgi:hypothetical protein
MRLLHKQKHTYNCEFIFVHMLQDTKKTSEENKISDCNSVIIQTCEFKLQATYNLRPQIHKLFFLISFGFK